MTSSRPSALTSPQCQRSWRCRCPARRSDSSCPSVYCSHSASFHRTDGRGELATAHRKSIRITQIDIPRRPLSRLPAPGIARQSAQTGIRLLPSQRQFHAVAQPEPPGAARRKLDRDHCDCPAARGSFNIAGSTPSPPRCCRPDRKNEAARLGQAASNTSPCALTSASSAPASRMARSLSGLHHDGPRPRDLGFPHPGQFFKRSWFPSMSRVKKLPRSRLRTISPTCARVTCFRSRARLL